MISWDDITKEGGFLDKLNQASGCDPSTLAKYSVRYKPVNVPVGCYRLPTEAEWEYAARAGSITRFSFGDDLGYYQLGHYGWYSANSGNKTQAVGQKLPNRWGLYDMHGNVRENTYNLESSYSSQPQLDPSGPSLANGQVSTERNHRGGSWKSGAANLRSASRRNGNYGAKNNIGLRLVKVIHRLFPSNNAPTANHDVGSTSINKPVTLNVLANDTDSDGDALSITNLSVVSAGSAVIVSDKTAIRVTPLFNSIRTVTFSYQIVDEKGGSSTANVSVNVSGQPVDDAPHVRTWVEPHYSIEMIKISSGTFTMGSPNGEVGRSAIEGPQHEVTISKDFFMAKFEITQEEWSNVMGGANPWPHSQPSAAYGASTSHPAYNLDWTDITGSNGF